ncbi:hypothetical protein [Arcticibacter tournemirensis]|uniref:Uncharacterized protein n=1 Tax=Arcticibacter tournemirensis TaxID=699437 RepID=A0A4Q0MA39_9SPHI|nr:hypothetical protein [Arcticibacter tournemirensis]RXF70100.1 hypothetical protein EKH83_09445 [Arcticibacter tournemirensis]
MNYYVVKYSGPFGFIKPWTAVRDIETFSQQFLTPSIVEGIEKKLFPELLNEEKYPKGEIYKIRRHRLAYEQISQQQEQIQPRGWNKGKNCFLRPNAILIRGVLLNPTIWLAFEKKEDANAAFLQHICLSRNEDMLFPEEQLMTSSEDFDSDVNRFSGFELVFEKNEEAFAVGYNRYRNNEIMYGWLKSVGHPVKAF